MQTNRIQPSRARIAAKDSREDPDMARILTQPSLRSMRPASHDLERGLGSHGGLNPMRRQSAEVRAPALGISPSFQAYLRVNDTVTTTDEDEPTIPTGSQTEKDHKSSWNHITLLLISEYVGYTTLCLPWVFSKMSVVLATISLVLNVGLYIASSRILWQFCVRHPEVNDIVDIVAHLVKDKGRGMRIFTHVTTVFFYSITIAVMAFHIVSGAEFIDTVSAAWSPSCKNIVLSIFAVLPCLAISLIRSFPVLSKMSIIAGVSTYISLIFACVYLAVHEKTVKEGPSLDSPTVSMGPAKNVTFVELVVSFLTISFATNGSVTIPTFVRDMRNPSDFPKALYLSSAVVLATFAVFGGVVYSEIGTQYMTIPAMGTLRWAHKIVVFAFMVPTIVFLGALYAAVLARRAYTGLADWLRRKEPKAALTTSWGNCLWAMVPVTVWVAAWLVAGLVPFLSGLTSIVAATFVSTFGFIIPPCLWFSMRSADARRHQATGKRRPNTLLCLFWASMFIFGVCFMMGAGLYASIMNLLNEFKETGVGRPFACHRGCVAGSLPDVRVA